MLKKVSQKELAWYISCIALSVVGLTFIILGIVGDHLPYDSTLSKIQAGFSWRYIGLIILVISIAVFIVVLVVNAKKNDRVVERAIRRKQRLNVMMSDIDKKDDAIVIENSETK